MAKFPVDNDQYSRLLAQLNQAKVKTGDNATYQVIKQLITGLGKFADFSQTTFPSLTNPSTSINIGDLITEIENLINSIAAGTVWTENDESALLTQSRQVLAGLNISLDYTVPNKVTVNATGGSDPDAVYLTGADETAILPNSRELLPGANVTFDDTTPGERTINVAAGAGGVTSVADDNIYTSNSPDPIVATGTVSVTELSKSAIDSSLHRFCGGI